MKTKYVILYFFIFTFFVLFHSSLGCTNPVQKETPDSGNSSDGFTKEIISHKDSEIPDTVHKQEKQITPDQQNKHETILEQSTVEKVSEPVVEKVAEPTVDNRIIPEPTKEKVQKDCDPLAPCPKGFIRAPNDACRCMALRKQCESCSYSGECADNAECYNTIGNKYCFKHCGKGNTCDSGYGCTVTRDGKLCLPITQQCP